MSVEFKKTGIVHCSALEQPVEFTIEKNNTEIKANLLKNTYFTSDFSSYVILDPTRQFNGLPTYKINVTGRTALSYIGYSQQVLGIKAGDVVTVSVGIYRQADCGIDQGTEMRMYQTHTDGTTNWTGFAPSLSTGTAGKGIRVSRTYTVDSNFAAGYFNVNVVQNGTYGFSAPKVEINSKITPGIPNPEDDIYTKYSFNTLNNTIENVTKTTEILEN